MHATPSLEIEADAYVAFNVITSVCTGTSYFIDNSAKKTSRFNKLGICSQLLRVKAYEKLALVVI